MEGIKHNYRIKIDHGKDRSPWRATLVMSSLPAYQLPNSMKSQGVKLLCSLESVLDRGDLKLKNRHWYALFLSPILVDSCYLNKSQVQHWPAVLPRRI
jgi:hypothetical protein